MLSYFRKLEVRHLNERIKKLRKDLGLTQQEFAQRIGSKRTTIAKYETDTNTPSSAVISLICREFNVSETWLRTGEGDMFVPAPNIVLDALAQKYGLSARSKIIVEKFLDLKPDIQEAIAAYIEEVAASFLTGGVSSVLQGGGKTLEQEADEFAAMAREQFLEEKRRESQTPSAGGSDGGGADGGKLV